MLIKEYRITLPMTVDEYQVGQLYAVAEASKNETGGGEGVEVIKNEPYEDVPLLNGKFTKGQYTYKIYRLQSKVPGWIKAIVPNGSFDMHEEAWNAYPYCKTVISNPGYMKDNFYITIETYHLADRGDSENVHELDKKTLKDRNVVPIDIANDTVASADYKVFCWLDKWHGMTMADIRELEEETKARLDEERNKGKLKGTTAIEK